MYLHSLPTLYAANISVILKTGKPQDACGSYRPISLTNVDSRIFSKLLARRLEGYLPLILKDDQTGFIKNRISQTNMRKLFNIIQYTQNYQKQGLVISLDAEKAFDRIE